MLDILPAFLTHLVYQSPVLVILLIGMVYSATKLNQLRTPASLAIAGFGLLLIMRLIGMVVSISLPLWFDDFNIRVSEFSFVMGIWNLISTIITAGGFVLLITAIFEDRSGNPQLDG